MSVAATIAGMRRKRLDERVALLLEMHVAGLLAPDDVELHDLLHQQAVDDFDSDRGSQSAREGGQADS